MNPSREYYQYYETTLNFGLSVSTGISLPTIYCIEENAFLLFSIIFGIFDYAAK